ncbi:M1 family aminopeptidase [Allomuricauda taeanensis]|uniref:M1 family aminopeptidase n=1 Tax=Flagellimonas taeanensis TaxID=1005926 RepID=UPI002E7B3BC7|nr:M1 family aminopeptidase [Allomuricauda taeanensis]MEE1964207.1 M1 family aminopeptidase [Allomuricauda taeanensis]
MGSIFLNDIRMTLRQKSTYGALMAYLGIGFWVGYKLNISVGDNLAINAPYSVGFMIGLMSLTIILMATVLAFSVLFKEADANFGLIVFSTPVRKRGFALMRFCSFFVLTLLSFFILTVAYVIGLHAQSSGQMNIGFHLWHYLYPFALFGITNTLLVCGILFFVAQKFQNKLLVAVTGLLLYIVYMVSMVFTNAPFMAQSLPQSLMAQRISALVDVFGLSAYFFEAKDLTLAQRNLGVVPFSNSLLINRWGIAILSFGMLYWGIRAFSFLPIYKSNVKRKTIPLQLEHAHIPFIAADTWFHPNTKWQAIVSFIKIDMIYLFKSIALVAVSVLLLFYVGMEMYGDIDMGIRMPQLYASSGLLAQTINSIFYFIGALVMVYFVNDIYWRSNASGFSIIQDTTYYAKEKWLGHVGSIVILVSYLTGLMILEALVFQILFRFFVVDWQAYFGVVIFNTLPLLLFSFFLLLVNSITQKKSLALGISILVFLVFASPISKSLINNPVLRFLSGYNGPYSDFLGYGPYLSSFLWRLAFGFSLVTALFLIYHGARSQGRKAINLLGVMACMSLGTISGFRFLDGHKKKDKDVEITQRADYEKTYRSYQNSPQPTISDVTARIDLYPESLAYHIKGNYVVKNKQIRSIDSILLNIPEDFELVSLVYQHKNERHEIGTHISEIHLKEGLSPQDSATLAFELRYQWKPINGLESFNAILKNGSFMRISRFFPTFGYDETREISDLELRKKQILGEATLLPPLEAQRIKVDDFINLSLQISTPEDQVAIGTGELIRQWKNEERNYFEYRATAIPFRFAVASAAYATKEVDHNGIAIRVHYNPIRGHNVDHLIANTRLALDYCIKNFGPYPFGSVTFAEVSAFTKGFAGTAYPAVIYMTENMTFNANIATEQNQDVVNELAGHEVAHFWWGTNQIDPDYREGHAMLTESLAMYTEMMLYKQMHGKAKMMERVAIHQQIYDAEKGFHEESSLLKASTENLHMAYSKGAVVFVELSELIGEQQLNLALKIFLEKHGHPSAKPISTDLLHEILGVSDKKLHRKILDLFEEKNISLSSSDTHDGKCKIGSSLHLASI